MASTELHERDLPDRTKDLHRAIVSLMEELEAVDWYQQRADACTDDELRTVLEHNRDEEIEHAMMNLEWIRRNQPTFAANVATYIGSSGPITQVEKSAKAGGGESGGGKDNSGGPGGSSPRRDGSLGIGSLRAAPATEKGK